MTEGKNIFMNLFGRNELISGSKIWANYSSLVRRRPEQSLCQ